MNLLTVNFVPKLKTVGKVGLPTINELKAETSLFSASPDFVRERGGPISKALLNATWGMQDDFVVNALESGLNPIIDIRVQRLMPGMYPSIPGWHCDAVPRKDYDSQPDYLKLNQDTIHYTCVLGTKLDGVSLTEFVTAPCTIPFKDGAPIWRQTHQFIEEHNVARNKIRNGDIVRFDSYSIHRATPATSRGWRLFYRFSMMESKARNELPDMQQVYVLSEENGW